jgi:hypothetical protein
MTMNRLRLRSALAVWAVILVVLSLRTLVSPRANSVYPIFSDAGRKWLAAANLYDPPVGDLDQYRYSPIVAAGFAPLALLPDRPAGVAWRWLNAGVFLGALAVWCYWWWEKPNVAAALLLVVPLAVGGLNNGQCNALLAGLLLAATVAFARGRWALAAAAATVAVLFKGYPIALGLLFCVLEPRRFAPRLALGLLAGFALPYLLQRPEYVTAQYSDFFARLRADDRTVWPIHASYRDLQMLLRLAGWNASLHTYRGLEVLLGLGCAGTILVGKLRGWGNHALVGTCFALSACWMTFCGPATESCTYVLLAPVLAQAMLEAGDRRWPWRVLIHASFVLFILSAVIVWSPRWIASPVQSSGVQPLAAGLLTVSVLADCWRELRRPIAGPVTGSFGTARAA